MCTFYLYKNNQNQHTIIQLVSAEDSSKYVTLYDWMPNNYNDGSNISIQKQLVYISNLSGNCYLKMYAYRTNNLWSYIGISYLKLVNINI